MKLSSIRIGRYRCVLDLTLQVESLTGLIGMNGSGKSAILRALAAFYGEGGLIQPEDWYGADTAQEIEVTVTFAELAEDERESFSHYVGPDGRLQIARVWRLEEGRIRDSLHGYHLAAPDFDVVRQAEKSIAALHNNLVDSGKYPGLERVSSAAQSEEALRRWEASHQERCRWVRDNGKFFGWNQVGGARLAAASVCVYVPAVREAREDAAEGKGSALSKIVDLVLREELRRNSDLAELREATGERFREILASTRPALSGLAGELSGLMAEFVPGSAVSLDWREGAPALPDWPSIEARLSEDGVETPFGQRGMGSSVPSLSVFSSDSRSCAPMKWQATKVLTSAVATRHTLLLVEEPELYQHPLAARRFATVLRSLAESDGGTQVVYSTHDPIFVSFDHFDAVRRVQKVPGDDGPPTTRVVALTLAEVRKRLVDIWSLDPDTVTHASTRERLRTVLTDQVSEGFFARAVVLVEGEQDRAMIEGLAAARGIDLVVRGVAIVPVGGKGNLDRAHIVFTGFGIPTYLVLDADAEDTGHRDQHARVNRVLLGLADAEPEDFPTTHANVGYTVFGNTLETDLRAVAGAEWATLLDRCSEAAGLPLGRDVLKTSYGCRDFVARIQNKLGPDSVFNQLVDRIGSL